MPNAPGGLEVEGWGNVFIEAAACARPVVVGRLGRRAGVARARGDRPARRRIGRRGRGRRRRVAARGSRARPRGWAWRAALASNAHSRGSARPSSSRAGSARPSAERTGSRCAPVAGVPCPGEPGTPLSDLRGSGLAGRGVVRPVLLAAPSSATTSPARLDRPAKPPAEAARGGDRDGGGGLEVEEGRPTWVCPVCDEPNPIEAAVCATCGTPFTRLFEAQDRAPGRGAADRGDLVDRSARARALEARASGGCGRADRHVRVGVRRPDRAARVEVRQGRPRADDAAVPAVPRVVACAIYVLSAIDAYRIASGDAPLVSSRTLLWASAGVVVLSVFIASFVTLPAARR